MVFIQLLSMSAGRGWPDVAADAAVGAALQGLVAAVELDAAVVRAAVVVGRRVFSQ